MCSIGFMVIIFMVVSCLFVFIRLILVVRDVLVWLVKSRVVMMGLSLCMRLSVISRFIVLVEL